MQTAGVKVRVECWECLKLKELSKLDPQVTMELYGEMPPEPRTQKVALDICGDSIEPMTLHDSPVPTFREVVDAGDPGFGERDQWNPTPLWLTQALFEALPDPNKRAALASVLKEENEGAKEG